MSGYGKGRWVGAISKSFGIAKSESLMALEAETHRRSATARVRKHLEEPGSGLIRGF